MTENLPVAALLCALAVPMLSGCDEPARTEPAERPLGVVSSLDTNILYIGDLVELRVAIAHPREGRLKMPDLARDKALVIRDRDMSRTELDSEYTLTHLRYDLTSFVVGDHTLFTNALVFALLDGGAYTQDLPELTLHVQSSLTGDVSRLQPLKDLARWPHAFPRWAVVLVAVAILALVAGLLAVRFLSKPRTILRHAPPPPPDVIALKALRALRNKRLIEDGEVETFYVELSAIVRQYLEGRFALHAPEQTTEEFIRDASTSPSLAPEFRELTVQFLEQADLVKFARFRPQREDMETTFTSAERLVEQTRQPTHDAESKSA